MRRTLHPERMPIIIFMGIMVTVLVVFSLASEHFLTSTNILLALKHLSITSLTALGLTFVVVTGYSDMAFHFLSCFAAMTMSYLIGLGWQPVPSILVGLVAGAFFGVLNGLAVGRFKLPDMVATIGLGSVAWGVAYLYSGGSYIYKNFFTSGILQLSDAKVGAIPLPVVYMFTLYFVAYVLLHRSKFGRRFYAIGSNQLAARFSGIRVSNYIVAAFIISAVLSSFTNMVMTAAQGNGNVKGGLVLLMPAYAAVFVGISIFKKPTVLGTFFGAFLISMMQNGFTLLSAPFYVMDLVVGTVLLVSIVLSKIEFSAARNQSLSVPAGNTDSSPIKEAVQ